MFIYSITNVYYPGNWYCIPILLWLSYTSSIFPSGGKRVWYWPCYPLLSWLCSILGPQKLTLISSRIKFIIWFISLAMLLVSQPKCLTIICIITLSTCFNCNTLLPSKIHFSQTPKILAFDLTNRNVTLSTKVSVMGVTHSTVLHLRGLIYYGDLHFTCRIMETYGFMMEWPLETLPSMMARLVMLASLTFINAEIKYKAWLFMPNVHLRTEERMSFCCVKQQPSSSKW